MILHPATVKAINAVAMPVLGFALICMACALIYFAFGWWQNRRYEREKTGPANKWFGWGE